MKLIRKEKDISKKFTIKDIHYGDCFMIGSDSFSVYLKIHDQLEVIKGMDNYGKSISYTYVNLETGRLHYIDDKDMSVTPVDPEVILK